MVIFSKIKIPIITKNSSISPQSKLFFRIVITNTKGNKNILKIQFENTNKLLKNQIFNAIIYFWIIPRYFDIYKIQFKINNEFFEKIHSRFSNKNF